MLAAKEIFEAFSLLLYPLFWSTSSVMLGFPSGWVESPFGFTHLVFVSWPSLIFNISGFIVPYNRG